MSIKSLTVDDLTEEIVEKAISIDIVNQNSVLANAAIKEISVNEEIVNQINLAIKDVKTILEMLK